MSISDEPILDMHDIQGHVFPGFGSAFSAVVAFRLSDPDEGRRLLGRLVPEVTTMASAMRDKEMRRASFIAKLGFPAQPVASLAIALSNSSLTSWGLDEAGHDLSFREGMLRDAEALGDPINENRQPIDWIFGQDDASRVDLILIGGHSSTLALEGAVDRWVGLLAPAWTEVQRDYGRRRPGDKEFFGFNDGISQPAMRGLTLDSIPVSPRFIDESDERAIIYARPGQRLIWPGSFIFGYERQVSDAAAPGPVFDPPQPWMRNGSYLVFRRLRQEVDKFQVAVARLVEHIAAEGHAVSEEWAAARMVGRWQDGTPLMMSPDAPAKEIGRDPNRNNNFQYAGAFPPTPIVLANGDKVTVPATPSDTAGRFVPFMAHVRQINPRMGRSEEGPETHPPRLMLRRGITYGPEPDVDPAADRGLLFLSYQTSIVRQFKFVQTTWANSEELPRPNGRDPIIGQDGTTDTQRHLKFPGPGGARLGCPFNGRWVIPTGGAYLFAPGIDGLRELTVRNPPTRNNS